MGDAWSQLYMKIWIMGRNVDDGGKGKELVQCTVEEVRRSALRCRVVLAPAALTHAVF